MSRTVHKLSKPILLIVAAVLLVAAACLVWNQRGGDDEPLAAEVDPYANLDLDEPQPSFLLLQYVSDHGGDEYMRHLAIEWLDDQARLRTPLASAQSDWLLGMLESGGHSDWAIGIKLWIFNSAFNCLHMDADQERFTQLLQRLSLSHPHKSMRLYALQHINVQRKVGNLNGKLAQEVRASLEQLAFEEDSEVAGTALANLMDWEKSKSQSGPDGELIELALKLAAESSRPADIRVTALHAIDHHALELSRQIAIDANEPMHVRKAAIGCIGKFGDQADTAALQQLKQEHFRLSQAAEPALEVIRYRATNPKPRKLIQF